MVAVLGSPSGGRAPFDQDAAQWRPDVLWYIWHLRRRWGRCWQLGTHVKPLLVLLQGGYCCHSVQPKKRKMPINTHAPHVGRNTKLTSACIHPAAPPSTVDLPPQFQNRPWNLKKTAGVCLLCWNAAYGLPFRTKLKAGKLLLSCSQSPQPLRVQSALAPSHCLWIGCMVPTVGRCQVAVLDRDALQTTRTAENRSKIIGFNSQV